MKDIPTSPRIIQIKRKRKVGRIRLIILCLVLFISIIGALSYYSFDNLPSTYPDIPKSQIYLA